MFKSFRNKYQEMKDDTKKTSKIMKSEKKEKKEKSESMSSSSEFIDPEISDGLEIKTPTINEDQQASVDVSFVKDKEAVKKPNKIMQSLDLCLNTTIFKKIIQSKIDQMDMDKKISMSASFVSICILSEYIIEKLIRLSNGNNVIDNNGLTVYDYIKLENEILKNIDLKNNFLKYIYNFDKSKDYYNYSINGNIIRIFARNKIDKSITLKPDLVNFICYVINDIVNTVLNKSIQLLIYMNKKLLKPDIIKFVVSHEFTDTFFKDLEIYMDKIQGLKITQENSKKEDEKELEGDDD